MVPNWVWISVRFSEYDRWKTKILNYFGPPTSAAVEGINNKARVITKRTYGLKSAKSLWDRLILDLNGRRKRSATRSSTSARWPRA